MSRALKFRDGFDWRRVAWSRPDSPTPSICSYCFGPLPDVPLMLFREDNSALSLCDACVEEWITSEVA